MPMIGDFLGKIDTLLVQLSYFDFTSRPIPDGTMIIATFAGPSSVQTIGKTVFMRGT